MTAVKWLVKEFARYYAIHQLEDEIDQALEMENQQMATNSSQPVTDTHALEISDEEIEKAAELLGNNLFGSFFIIGAKWYRKQLKQRK
jgi:hypothetical protein